MTFLIVFALLVVYGLGAGATGAVVEDADGNMSQELYLAVLLWPFFFPVLAGYALASRLRGLP